MKKFRECLTGIQNTLNEENIPITTNIDLVIRYDKLVNGVPPEIRKETPNRASIYLSKSGEPDKIIGILSLQELKKFSDKLSKYVRKLK